jgi:hypothetical protein
MKEGTMRFGDKLMATMVAVSASPGIETIRIVSIPCPRTTLQIGCTESFNHGTKAAIFYEESDGVEIG